MVEAIVSSVGPGELTIASRHLGAYYGAFCSEWSPNHSVLQSLEQWTHDLVHVASKFGHALEISPSAIYRLIPSAPLSL